MMDNDYIQHVLLPYQPPWYKEMREWEEQQREVRDGGGEGREEREGEGKGQVRGWEEREGEGTGGEGRRGEKRYRTLGRGGAESSIKLIVYEI